jgi:perosamine synthetase
MSIPRKYGTPTGFSIPVSYFQSAANTKKYVDDSLEANWITMGPVEHRFARELAIAHQCKHAIVCNSGTAALHMAMLAAGVGNHAAVIVPSLTYIATANAAHYCGAHVICADVDPETWTMTRETAMEAFQIALSLGYASRHIYIVPVHLYDCAAGVVSLSDTFGMDRVIVDASHSAGRRADKAAASTLSFYASKVIASGEGGAVLTNDGTLAAKVSSLRGQGALQSGIYFHTEVGYNYRMTDIAAGIGLSQLEVLPEILEYRRAIASLYRELLADKDVTFQSVADLSAWTFPILLPSHVDAGSVASRLSFLGVETRPFFIPIHKQPAYAATKGGTYHNSELAVASDLAERGLLLPLHLNVSAADVAYIANALTEAMEYVAADPLAAKWRGEEA